MSRPRLTGSRCACVACGLAFTSEREFNRHRVGTFANPGEWKGARRCLPVAELLVLGLRLNEAGQWMKVRPQATPAGLESTPVTLPATSVGAKHGRGANAESGR